MPIGIITKVYGTVYSIIDEQDPSLTWQASLRGRLRLKKARPPRARDYQKQRHLAAVGDRVYYKVSAADPPGRMAREAAPLAFIEEVLERRNSLERSTRYERQCLAANLDRSLIVLSLSHPKPRFAFLERFLCAAWAGGVEAWIIFSKTDLLASSEQRRTLQEYSALYTKLAYKVFCLNLLDRASLESLRHMLASGMSLFVGQSGVGKSTLFNQLIGSKTQRTSPISQATTRGKHTTTNTSLIVCPDKHTFYIDSPGIEEWGIAHLSTQDVLEAFPETRPYTKKCMFSDCLHDVSSSGCAVRKLLDRSHAFYKNKTASQGEESESQTILRASRLQALESILSAAKSSGNKQRT